MNGTGMGAALEGLPEILPWLAVAFSAVVMALAATMRLVDEKKAKGELAVLRKGAAALSAKCDNLENDLRALRMALANLRGTVARLDAARAGLASDADEPFVTPRVKQFVDLVMAWTKETGHGLRGAASQDWSAIEELTKPGRQELTAEESETVFAAAARRVVEYAVIASGTPSGLKVTAADEKKVGNQLGAMAELAGLKLIEPERGKRPDPRLHEPVNTVAAGGNQPGTIAKIEVRGLVRGNGSVMKAKVYLYD